MTAARTARPRGSGAGRRGPRERPSRPAFAKATAARRRASREGGGPGRSPVGYDVRKGTSGRPAAGADPVPLVRSRWSLAGGTLALPALLPIDEPDGDGHSGDYVEHSASPGTGWAQPTCRKGVFPAKCPLTNVLPLCPQGGGPPDLRQSRKPPFTSEPAGRSASSGSRSRDPRARGASDSARAALFGLPDRCAPRNFGGPG